MCTLARKSPATREIFQIEELVFFEAMHGFHVALVGVGGGRDAHMPTVTAGFGILALKLAAVVGLPDQIAARCRGNRGAAGYGR